MSMKTDACTRCGAPRKEHEFTELRCPDGSSGRYRQYAAQPARASTSFSRGELAAVAELLKRARTVPELRAMARNTMLVALERKVLGMISQIDTRGKNADTPPPPPPQQEST